MRSLSSYIQPIRKNLPAIRRVAKDLMVVRYEPRVLPEAIPFLNPIDQICEQPPPRFMWSSHYILFAMFCTLLVAAAFTKVDVVVIGGGTLATQSPPIVLQPMDRGIVRELLVSPGETVKKGQVLALLDPTFARADLAMVAGQERGSRAQIKRIEAELTGKPYQASANPDQDEITQMSLFQQRTEQYQARLRVFDEDIKSRQANIRTTQDDRDSLAKQLDYARQMEKMRADLYQSQNGSKLNFLDAQTLLVRTERDYQDAVNRLVEQQHDLQSKQAERQNFIEEWRGQLTESLVTARSEADRAHEALSKATLMNNLVEVTAPADAVVLDVAKRSAGSIINAAEPLFTLIPENAPLVADITVSSADIGYIKQGDEVVVKVGAFPYQRHGWLKGHLLYISEESFAMREAGGDPANTKEPGAGHRGRVILDDLHLNNLPQGARLIPGMTVSAEIKVSKRSVLAFFLLPLTKGLNESLREP